MIPGLQKDIRPAATHLGPRLGTTSLLSLCRFVLGGWQWLAVAVNATIHMMSYQRHT